MLLQILSPGDTVGTTDFDWQGNGSLGRRICHTLAGGYHFVWTYRTGGSGANRRVYYNYFHPPNYWLGPTMIDLRVSRNPSISSLADGRAVIASNASAGGNIICALYIDAAEGAGMFTIIDLGPLLWPKLCVDSFDYIYLSGTDSSGGVITYSTDYGTTWSEWFNIDPLYWNGGGRESWTTYNNKIALINDVDYDLSYCYWESTNHGVTWCFDTIFTSLPSGDSVIGYIWHSGVYDNSGNLHVVFTVIDTAANGGGPGGSGWRSQIRHWDSQTDSITIVTSGWWTLNPGPGDAHPTVSECQIAIDRATGILYCTWC